MNNIVTENENKEPVKKKSIFWRVVWVYIAAWIVLTIVVCAVLNSKVSEYQTKYDEAAAKIDPDKTANENVYLFDKEHFLDTLGSENIVFSQYEKQENIDSYLESIIPTGELSIERTEDYSESKPVYDVFSKNDKIGQIYLKKQATADEFGFHDYELAGAVVTTTLDALNKYTIECFEGSEIYINDMLVDIEGAINTEGSGFEFVEDKELKSFIEKEAEEKGGAELKKVIYRLSEFTTKPKVICKIDDHLFEPTEAENEFVFSDYFGEAFSKILDDVLRAKFIDASEAYVRYMNRYGYFGALSNYLEPGSKAYYSIASAQSGLSWAGRASEFEIKSSDIRKIEKIGDGALVVTTHHDTYRNYRGKEYNEELNIDWLYVYNNGIWRIRNFSL